VHEQPLLVEELCLAPDLISTGRVLERPETVDLREVLRRPRERDGEVSAQELALERVHGFARVAVASHEHP